MKVECLKCFEEFEELPKESSDGICYSCRD